MILLYTTLAILGVSFLYFMWVFVCGVWFNYKLLNTEPVLIVVSESTFNKFIGWACDHTTVSDIYDADGTRVTKLWRDNCSVVRAQQYYRNGSVIYFICLRWKGFCDECRIELTS